MNDTSDEGQSTSSFQFTFKERLFEDVVSDPKAVQCAESHPYWVILILAALGGFTAGSGFVLHQTTAVVIGLALFGTALLWFLYSVNARGFIFRRYYKRVSEIYTQLRALQDEVTRYLSDLDRRTSKYFHCVTNTKVTTYFMLRQIEQGLSQLNDDLKKSSRLPGGFGVVRSYELISSPFQYSNGFIFNSGETFDVPLQDLPQEIEKLVKKLERSLRELEDEIQQAGGSYSAPEGGTTSA